MVKGDSRFERLVNTPLQISDTVDTQYNEPREAFFLY